MLLNLPSEALFPEDDLVHPVPEDDVLLFLVVVHNQVGKAHGFHQEDAFLVVPEDDWVHPVLS